MCLIWGHLLKNGQGFLPMGDGGLYWLAACGMGVVQWAKDLAHFCANGPKQDTEVHAPAHAQNVSHLEPSAQKWTGFFAHGRWWALLARGLRHGRGSMGQHSPSNDVERVDEL